MLKHLVLERPLAVIDLETTGTDLKTDRVIEVSVLRLVPAEPAVQHTRRVNPGRPIPPEASAVHGITDADVADAPPFGQIAPRLLAFLDGCDLCGFNLKRFDLPLLAVEFHRAGLSLSTEGRAIVDPLEIFHHFERRDLSAAVRFYCGRDHVGAHGAGADVLATAEVLDAMLGRYGELPRSVAGLHSHFRDPNAVDGAEMFTRVEGELRFKRGKHRGQSLDDVARLSPDYLEWMLNDTFLEDTKALVRAALGRVKKAAPANGSVSAVNA